MKGYRTLIINTLSIAIQIAEMNEWTDIVPAEYTPHFTICLGLANVALRFVTTTAVGKSL